MSKLNKLQEIFNRMEGSMFYSEPLWRHTSMLVGGPAELYAVPGGEDDLKILLAGAKEDARPVSVIGGGTNILAEDAGIQGLVIDTRELREERVERENSILVLGAGNTVSDSVWRAGTQGFGGLDFLFGMPGSVGGAIWMNARCYDFEIADFLEWTEVMGKDGHVKRIPMNRADWEYKRSPFQNNECIILRAGFRIEKGNPLKLREKMVEKRNDREAKGHYRAPCAGSAFKNNRSFGAPSGAIIDRCGLKGLRSGGASVSSWHANIIINDSGASAADVHRLMETIRETVQKQTGFLLSPEIVYMGEKGEE